VARALGVTPRSLVLSELTRLPNLAGALVGALSATGDASAHSLKSAEALVELVEAVEWLPERPQAVSSLVTALATSVAPTLLVEHANTPLTHRASGLLALARVGASLLRCETATLLAPHLASATEALVGLLLPLAVGGDAADADAVSSGVEVQMLPLWEALLLPAAWASLRKASSATRPPALRAPAFSMLLAATIRRAQQPAATAALDVDDELRRWRVRELSQLVATCAHELGPASCAEQMRTALQACPPASTAPHDWPKLEATLHVCASLTTAIGNTAAALGDGGDAWWQLVTSVLHTMAADVPCAPAAMRAALELASACADGACASDDDRPVPPKAAEAAAAAATLCVACLRRAEMLADGAAHLVHVCRAAGPSLALNAAVVTPVHGAARDASAAAASGAASSSSLDHAVHGRVDGLLLAACAWLAADDGSSAHAEALAQLLEPVHATLEAACKHDAPPACVSALAPLVRLCTAMLPQPVALGDASPADEHVCAPAGALNASDAVEGYAQASVHTSRVRKLRSLAHHPWSSLLTSRRCRVWQVGARALAARAALHRVAQRCVRRERRRVGELL
jgi:hypothetical protein